MWVASVEQKSFEHWYLCDRAASYVNSVPVAVMKRSNSRFSKVEETRAKEMNQVKILPYKTGVWIPNTSVNSGWVRGPSEIPT